ncbi:MAG: hypothetical protein ACRCYR_10110 [Phycicoccus sp.]
MTTGSRRRTADVARARDRARLARRLHPDLGGDPAAFADALAAFDRTPTGAGVSSWVTVRRTWRGRARRRIRLVARTTRRTLVSFSPSRSRHHVH